MPGNDTSIFDNPKVQAFIDATKSFAAGGGAGAISKSAVAPIERTKILSQIERLRGTYRSNFKIAADVFKYEGVFAFWKGNGANCIRIIPNKGILFMCNDLILDLFRKDNQPLTPNRRLLAGSLSGAVLITATYPLDITQTRLASGAKFDGIIHCLKDTIKVEGVRGVFKGYIPSLLGVVPYTGVQFMTFDIFKTYINNLIGNKYTMPNIWINLIAGGCAGVVAQSVSYPFDTVRRRIQVQGRIGEVQYTGMLNCFKTIYLTEGVKGFFRGIVLNAFRAGPSQAIQFASFNILKKLLGLSGSNNV